MKDEERRVRRRERHTKYTVYVERKRVRERGRERESETRERERERERGNGLCCSLLGVTLWHLWLCIVFIILFVLPLPSVLKQPSSKIGFQIIQIQLSQKTLESNHVSFQLLRRAASETLRCLTTTQRRTADDSRGGLRWRGGTSHVPVWERARTGPGSHGSHVLPPQTTSHSTLHSPQQ